MTNTIASFWDREDKTKRGVRDITIGQALTRVYRIPVGGEALIPAYGAVLDGATGALTSARFKHWRYGEVLRGPDAGLVEIVCTFIQPVAFA